jgi:hypothetical protein
LELFLKKKDELKDRVVELIKELKNDNIQVKFLRLDDAGENLHWKRNVRNKIWRSSLNIVELVHHKEMERLNANFKHCMVEFEQ